ncbi:fimbria/pilus periplasmic chaperone [Enterobacteriaceae bacterium 4M9]|nr:fimbria/pilus periplasmic chaperone [Enterobacteriaceae bacterium 4M9]
MKNIILPMAALFISLNASASVVINQTRVIYPATAKFVSVQLVNDSEKTHLVQSWLDTGNASAAPENIKVPFSLTPPVVKMAARSGQIIKIAAMNTQSLPSDRESVFWLNVLDVPPVPEANSESYMQVAIRNRIKLFYRPASLEALDSKVLKNLSLSSAGGHACLKNNSPYYLTIVQIVTWKGGVLKQTRNDNLLADTAFIQPFDCAPVANTIRAGGEYRVTWLDDYGAKRFSTLN